MKIASEYDSKGKLSVDCTECKRGHNGTDPNKCAAGNKHKKPYNGSCFLGEPIPEIQKKLELLANKKNLPPH